jgi:hypothetical protein
MKNGYIKSSPHFFRLITVSLYSLVLALILLAALIPAPLQEQANPAVTPNPAKSAWFLLWIQEVVSWSSYMIYPVVLLALLIVLLPWLPLGNPSLRAHWFSKNQKVVNAVTVLMVLFLVLVSIIAGFFRGTNWSFVF